MFGEIGIRGNPETGPLRVPVSGEFVFSYNLNLTTYNYSDLCYNNFMKNMLIEESVAKALKKKKGTVCCAESCTGGLVSSRITDVSGSSAFFLGGVVSYSNAAKTKLLGVDRAVIKKHGAVSPQVARLMAEGVRKKFSADHALSITGIAGPAGGNKNKPVGLAYIGISSKKGTRSLKVQYKGDRLEVKKKFAEAALKTLLKNI